MTKASAYIYLYYTTYDVIDEYKFGLQMRKATDERSDVTKAKFAEVAAAKYQIQGQVIKLQASAERIKNVWNNSGKLYHLLATEAGFPSIYCNLYFLDNFFRIIPPPPRERPIVSNIFACF